MLAKYQDWLEEEKLTLITGWARKGLTDEQISKNMGIAYSTLREWKKKYSALQAALKKGKEVVDYEVEAALYKRAIGYNVEEEKIYIQEIEGRTTKRKEIIKKHIPGDTTAQIFWLKNRKPADWRDRKETQLSGEIETKNNPFNELTADELRKLIDSE